MNIKQLADQCGISVKELIKKGRLLYIFPSNQNDRLSDVEMKILEKISNMSLAEIRGYSIGLRESTPADILSFITTKTPINPETNTQPKIDNTKIVRGKKKNDEFSAISEYQFHQLEQKVEELKILNSQVKELITRVATIEKNETVFLDEFASFEKKISELKEDSKIFDYENLFSRIDKAIIKSYSYNVELPNIRQINDVQSDFLKLNLAYPIKLLEKIATGLVKGHVIIVGPSGVGKTSLLKHIYLFYHKLPTNIIISYNTVIPDWDNYDIIGGKTIIANKLAPHLGIFFKEVIKCIETEKDTFFLLDELNRGRVEELFGGMMDYLGNSNNTLYFKELELVKDGIRSIKVPNNLKIICAMNKSDYQYLNPISNQIKRRFEIVDFTKNDFDIELQIFSEHVKTTKIRLNKHKQEKHIDNYFEIIKEIRMFEQELDFKLPLFGTSYMVSTLSLLETKIINGYNIDLDVILKDEIFSSIPNISPDIKQKLIENVLVYFNLKECISAISN